MKSDIDIAQAATKRPIDEIARVLGLAPEDLHHYGSYIAKIPTAVQQRLADRPGGKLILMTAMTPTPQAKARPPTRLASLRP